MPGFQQIIRFVRIGIEQRSTRAVKPEKLQIRVSSMYSQPACKHIPFFIQSLHAFHFKRIRTIRFIVFLYSGIDRYYFIEATAIHIPQFFYFFIGHIDHSSDSKHTHL